MTSKQKSPILTHKGTQLLETQRLILRPFTLDDAPAMFGNWASDSDVTAFLMWQAHSDLSVSRAVLADWVKNYDKSDYYQWAIVPKDFGAPIGDIAVVNQNDSIGMVHIGYAIGKNWWHRGYTSEALAEIMRFFFTQVHINRVESRHDPNNPNSGEVMRKCGMQYEGTLRQADFNNKGIVDACMYALLREDWERMFS